VPISASTSIVAAKDALAPSGIIRVSGGKAAESKGYFDGAGYYRTQPDGAARVVVYAAITSRRDTIPALKTMIRSRTCRPRLNCASTGRNASDRARLRLAVLSIFSTLVIFFLAAWVAILLGIVRVQFLPLQSY
jgi:hypothetical protein